MRRPALPLRLGIGLPAHPAAHRAIYRTDSLPDIMKFMRAAGLSRAPG